MTDIHKIISIIKEANRTLFILCGFPYAGKSYIAKQILSHTDVVFVSIDDIFHRHSFDWDSNTLPDAYEWEQIFSESYEEVRQSLRNGKNVLYDSTNQTVVSRDKLREIAGSVDTETKVIYIKASIENVWNRWKENQKNRTRSVVDKALVQQTINMFEEPTEEENVIIINN